MSLTLYMHPLSSFCHKVLIALYESAIAFEPRVVDLGNPVSRDEFKQVWPFAQFPVLRDATRSQTIPESTVIIEYLSLHYRGHAKLVPEDPEQALRARAADRFYDLHLHEPMQKVVGDKLRPADGHDPIGVAHAWEQMKTALRIADGEMAHRRWAIGDQFSMADCAAGPPLFFTNIMMPLAREFPHVSAYLTRLTERPSYARALQEAEPYLSMFPGWPRRHESAAASETYGHRKDYP
jgi:glutathione S-transferase